MSSSPPTEPPQTPTSRTLERRRREHHHGTKKITKDEKIFQLKSSLKISKEENNRLKKEIERLRSALNRQKHHDGDTGSVSNHSRGAPIDQKKFREAMRALKQVTVTQEKSIKALKIKSQQRRQEIKERDARIAKLEQTVKSLENAKELIKNAKHHKGGDLDLEQRFKKLMVLYDEERQKNFDLEEMLDLRESQMDTVQKQRNSLLAPTLKRNVSDRHKSSDNSVSSGSVSTNADFDVVRLKTELAKKSEKINKLEMDLEIMRDELHESKRRSQGSAASLGGISAFYGQNSFQVGGSINGEDDWTDAETDYESEFDESEFGNSQSFFTEATNKFAATSSADVFGGDSFFKCKSEDEDDNQKEFDFW